MRFPTSTMTAPTWSRLQRDRRAIVCAISIHVSSHVAREPLSVPLFTRRLPLVHYTRGAPAGALHDAVEVGSRQAEAVRPVTATGHRRRVHGLGAVNVLGVEVERHRGVAVPAG